MDQVPHPIRVMRIIARLNIGGPAIHVALLSAGLNDEQFQTMLVTGSLEASEGDMTYIADELEVKPVCLPDMGREIRLLKDFRAFLRLVRLMREFKPHIVHTHTAKAGLLGRAAAWITRVPIVLHTFHGHVFHGYFGKIKTFIFIMLERLAAAVSNVILTISERLKDELQHYNIAPDNKIRVVPLGFNLTPFVNSHVYKGALRHELGLSADTKLIGIIGRLVPVKDHHLFLDVARRLTEMRSDIKFIIVGDGELRAELEQRVHQEFPPESVIFLGWRRDLPVIYADLDVVVLTSRNEGTPVSLIEAMAASVPVVSAEVGGVADLLQEGMLGRLVSHRQPDQFAEIINRVLGEHDTERLKTACSTITTQYDGQRLIQDMCDLYMELLQR